MGKSKKIIFLGWGFFALALLAALALFFLPSRITEKKLKEELRQLGVKIQAEKWETASFGKKIILTEVLLTDPENLEYPILQAEKIIASASLKKIAIEKPKAILASPQQSFEPWRKLLAHFVFPQTSVQITDGTLELWKERPFTGVPFQLHEINLKGKLNQLAINAAIPGGLSALISFAPSARLFPKEKHFFSGQFDLSSKNSGKAENLKWNSERETIFQCASLTWHQTFHFDCKKPTLKIERSQMGQWRLGPYATKSLWDLNEELFGARIGRPFHILIQEGNFSFVDKHVFPLFQQTVEKVELSLDPQQNQIHWQFKGKTKNADKEITLEGNSETQMKAVDQLLDAVLSSIKKEN